MESTQSQQAGGETLSIQLGIFIPSPNVAVNKQKINTSKTDHSHKADRKRRNGTTLDSPDQNSSGDERLHTAAAGAKRRRKEMESANEGLPDENGTLREVEDRTTPRKKKRKRTRKGREENDVARTMSRERALEYLRQWDTDLPNWSFRKKAQYWLLKNMLRYVYIYIYE